jgi:tetratricopeptide (TPR) repeat protein
MGRAIDRSPNNGVWLNRQAGWLGRLGKFQRALELNREAVKRDPLSWNALNGLVAWSLFLGHRNEVDPIVTRETAVNEVQGRGISTLVFSFDGDRAAAVREYLRIYDLLTAQSGGVGFGWRNSVCLQFARLGLRDEVLSQIPALNAHQMLGEYAEALPALREEYRESGNWRFLLANALYGTGRFDEAAEQYRRLFATSDPYPDAASLLQAADAARRSGALQEAAAYRDRAAQLIDSAESAGADMRAISRERAMLFAFDGHAEEAARSLIVALDNWNAWVWSYQPTLWNPLLAPLMDRADFKAAQRSNSLVIEKQRAQVIEMLCGPSPVSKSYKPAPATCAKRNSRA